MIGRYRIIALIVALVGFGLLGLSVTTSQAQETVDVEVDDFYFCSSEFQGEECVTTIQAGDTVLWDFSEATSTHTTTGDAWDSGNLSSGTFSFTFDEAGEYVYHCSIHPTLMMGRIVVEAAPDTPVDSGNGQDGAATEAPSGGEGSPGVPKTGYGPDEGSTSEWWMAAALGAAGLMLAGAGTLAYRRTRK